MNWNLFILFCVLNIANVVIQTVKSLATIKCGKGVASLVNAVAYGLYTVVVVYTVCDLPLWLKVLVVAVSNLIGVFVVKWLEEKSRKDKLWKVEMAIPLESSDYVIRYLKQTTIPFNFHYLGKWCMFNCYCSNQESTKLITQIAKSMNGKISAYESKSLI